MKRALQGGVEKQWAKIIIEVPLQLVVPKSICLHLGIRLEHILLQPETLLLENTIILRIVISMDGDLITCHPKSMINPRLS